MMRKKVLFRVDAGGSVGAGHLMRCLALARYLTEASYEVVVACAALEAEYERLMREAGCGRLLLDDGLTLARDAQLCADYADLHQFDGVVVDHYGLDQAWESRLRGSGRILLVIDDLANRPHVCDALLDQNDCASTTSRYDELLPADSEFFLGPKFALLRCEFAVLRERCAPRGELKRLLVFFSASDEKNETAKALAGIAQCQRAWQVDVVTGASHPDVAGIARTCREQGWAHHHQVEYMAALMAEADLSLGSAGSASWERCAMGLPAILVQLADNQAEVMRCLLRHGAALSLGAAERVQASHYAQALDAFGPQKLAAMSQAAFELVDGKGVTRVAEWIMKRLWRR
ncbi:UDP-2,4-diacetamido-2,4,6-trideoxy-beta-L-altropyranose hydrolase [Chromobacterium haemolyticum]|nr:UDP-2,4-diacetamido-2,4,6-trideoxy-beta-L-altropyranose hydrolase [Chromobacterium haemolyticum]